MTRRIAALSLIAGCLGSGSAPDLANVTDPVAVVGTELVLDLEGTDADGDRLSYPFR